MGRSRGGLKQRTLLKVEKSCFDQISFSLQKKQAELEALCRQPDSAKNIEEIATSILRKNLRVALDKVNTRYRVTCSDTLSENQAASLIADAIINEVVQFRFFS